MGHVRNGGRHRRRGLALAALGLVAACASSGRAAVTAPSVGPGGTATAPGTVPPTVPSTAAPTIVATTPPTTVAPTTTAPPLSPDLLAGGMVLCSFSGAVLPQWALDRLHAGLSAGLLLYQRNLASEAQAAANGQAAQAAALSSPVALPAIVATDQEGGIVARIPGPPSSSAAAMGVRPAADVQAEGRATADLLLRWGVNTDLAPVADVARPGTFEARARRSFSGDPAVAAGGVTAFVSGLRAGGVAATLKHFPGLGAASANTDHANGVVDVPAADLDTVDLVPFRAGIGAGAQLVMVAERGVPGPRTRAGAHLVDHRRGPAARPARLPGRRDLGCAGRQRGRCRRDAGPGRGGGRGRRRRSLHRAGLRGVRRPPAGAGGRAGRRAAARRARAQQAFDRVALLRRALTASPAG